MNEPVTQQEAPGLFQGLGEVWVVRSQGGNSVSLRQSRVRRGQIRLRVNLGQTVDSPGRLRGAWEPRCHHDSLGWRRRTGGARGPTQRATGKQPGKNRTANR